MSNLYIQGDAGGDWGHAFEWEHLCIDVIKIFKFVRTSGTDYFIIPFTYSELITDELPNLTQDFIYDESRTSGTIDPRKIICINKNIASLTTLIIYSEWNHINHFVNPRKIEELSLNILSLIFGIMQENIDTNTYNSFLEIEGNVDDLILSCNRNSSVDKKILTNIFLIKNYVREIINCNNPIIFQSGYIVNLNSGEAKIYAYSNEKIEDFNIIAPKININIISARSIEYIRNLMNKPKPSDYPLLSITAEDNPFIYIEDVD